MERQTRRVMVATIDRNEWPDSLDGLIEHLEDMRRNISMEFRKGVQVDFDYDAYDGGAGWLEIFYDRPETDEEMAERLESQRRSTEDREAAERRQLAMLKAKYGEG